MFGRSLAWSLPLLLAVLPIRGEPPPETGRDFYGDPLPAGAIARMGTVRFRHQAEIVSVAFSPDGRTLASAGKDWVARVWDRASGAELYRFGSPSTYVRGLAYSPDGKFLAGASDDHSVDLRETATGKQRFCLTGLRGAAWTVAFAPDNRTVVAAGKDPILRLWDATTGKLLRDFEGHEKPVEGAAFSPDGKIIASAGRDETIRLWEAATGKEIRALEGHEGHVRSVAFSPDGKTLVSGGADWTVRLWEANTGKQLREIKAAENSITSVVFVPDGKSVAVVSEDGTIRLWETESGKESRQLAKPRSAIGAIAVAPDGKTLAAGSRDGDIQFWEIATGREIRPFSRHQNPVYTLALSPDGKSLVSGGTDPALHVWDRATGRPREMVAELGTEFTVIALSRDGRRFAALNPSEASIRVGDCASGKLLPSWRDHPFKGKGTGFLVFSPDGNLLASTDSDGVRFWDTASGKEVRRIPRNGVERAVFSPDGKQLATFGKDCPFQLWQTANGELLRELDKQPFVSADAAFSSDGQWLATASMDVETKQTQIRRWSLKKEQKPIIWNLYGHTPNQLVFTPDDRTLCVGLANGDVLFWETASGEKIGAFEGHWQMVQALACSSDSRTIFSGGFDTNILAWDLARLGQRGPREKDMQKLWADLAEDAPGAHAAIWSLVEQPQPALAMLQERLKPITADAARIARLVTDLDNDRFPVRQRATKELERLGELAEPLLRQTLAQGPALEVRRRVEYILGAGTKRLSSEQLRSLRALQVLERIGTPEARRLLEAVAAGAPGARLTREAGVAVQRLGRLPAR